MSGFVKFPSIEKFANTWHAMSRKPNPQPVTYGAKIKLHGTNGGVRVSADGTVVAQSRTRDLSVMSDNEGFCAWVMRYESEWAAVSQFANLGDVVFFGEWAGRGIKNKDAVTKLDIKYFFVFSVQVGDQMFTDPAFIEGLLPPHINEAVVLSWFPLPPFVVDFHNSEATNRYLNIINDAVEEIGVVDPYIRDEFGVEGPGEGLVMMPMYENDRDMFSMLTFKAKTEAHRVNASDKAVKLRAEVPPSVNEFVTMFVTVPRLEQALDEACDGIAERPRIASFLKWVGNDIIKESKLEIDGLGLDWKQVAGPVNKAAVAWFTQKSDQLV